MIEEFIENVSWRDIILVFVVSVGLLMCSFLAPGGVTKKNDDE